MKNLFLFFIFLMLNFNLFSQNQIELSDYSIQQIDSNEFKISFITNSLNENDLLNISYFDNMNNLTKIDGFTIKIINNYFVAKNENQLFVASNMSKNNQMYYFFELTINNEFEKIELSLINPNSSSNVVEFKKYN